MTDMSDYNLFTLTSGQVFKPELIRDNPRQLSCAETPEMTLSNNAFQSTTLQFTGLACCLIKGQCVRPPRESEIYHM